MTIHYSHSRLSDLIARLADLPDGTIIRGLSAKHGSYRGYYEHIGIEPGETTATELHDALAAGLGTTMHGYKGGEYVVSGDCLVFVAHYGMTGDRLIHVGDDGGIITMEDAWWLLRADEIDGGAK